MLTKKKELYNRRRQRSEIDRILQKQRAFFAEGKTYEIRFRKAALKRLEASILAHEKEVCQALTEDLGKSETEGYMCEVGLTLAEIRGLYRNVKAYSKTKRVPVSMANFPAKGYLVQEPYGVTLVMSPWNYPFQLLFAPLAGALAAGNCAVLKPSPRTPAVNEVMRKLISEVFAPEYVSFLEGGAETARALLQQRLDYIFFSGSPALGREVMTAAAARLIPLTLELGGKSPCVVDRTADVKIAARRIAWGKFLNAGQTCVAPDYLLVHREIVPELTAEIKLSVSRMFGADPRQSPYYGRLIGNEEVERMRRLMESGEVVFGGETDAAAQLSDVTCIVVGGYYDGQPAMSPRHCCGSWRRTVR